MVSGVHLGMTTNRFIKPTFVSSNTAPFTGSGQGSICSHTNSEPPPQVSLDPPKSMLIKNSRKPPSSLDANMLSLIDDNFGTDHRLLIYPFAASYLHCAFSFPHFFSEKLFKKQITSSHRL